MLQKPIFLLMRFNINLLCEFLINNSPGNAIQTDLNNHNITIMILL